MSRLFRTIWDLSEFTGIRLGRFAPFIFRKAFGLQGGIRIDKSPIWALEENEYDELNPPPQTVKYIDGKLFLEHLDDNRWLNIGHIPRPKSRTGWFLCHLIHGMVMHYPIHKVLLYAAMNSSPLGYDMRENDPYWLDYVVEKRYE